MFIDKNCGSSLLSFTNATLGATPEERREVSRPRIPLPSSGCGHSRLSDRMGNDMTSMSCFLSVWVNFYLRRLKYIVTGELSGDTPIAISK